MIVLALALAQAAAPDVRAEEVVVIGERLKTWRASWRTRGGKATCKTTRSSGDPAVDLIGCTAISECATQFNGRATALAGDKALNRAARKQANDVLNQDMGMCMMTKRDALIVELADRRAAERGAGS